MTFSTVLDKANIKQLVVVVKLLRMKYTQTRVVCYWKLFHQRTQKLAFSGKYKNGNVIKGE